jgi:hypothetical protein
MTRITKDMLLVQVADLQATNATLLARVAELEAIKPEQTVKPAQADAVIGRMRSAAGAVVEIITDNRAGSPRFWVCVDGKRQTVRSTNKTNITAAARRYLTQ